MEQSAAESNVDAASTPPSTDESDREFAAIVAIIDRLNDLGLADENGRAVIEPASAFHWL